MAWGARNFISTQAIDGAAHRVRASGPHLLERCDQMTEALVDATRFTDDMSAAIDDAAERARNDVRDAMDGLRVAVAHRVGKG